MSTASGSLNAPNPTDANGCSAPLFVTIPVEIESFKHKSVLQVPPGVISSAHKLIVYDGQYWVRNYCFAPSVKECWTPIEAEQVLELK